MSVCPNIGDINFDYLVLYQPDFITEVKTLLTFYLFILIRIHLFLLYIVREF